MKRILIFSLVGNLALLGLVAWHKPTPVGLPAREVRGEISSAPNPAHLRQARAVAPTQSGAAWSQIESRDIPQFIANLRASGCPEATIRDIVTFRIYRNSSAADYVRRNLPAAQSESEYRTMVKLALELELSRVVDSPQEHFGIEAEDEIKQGIQQRKKDYAERLKQALGEDRIAEQEQEAQAQKAAEAEASAKETNARMQQELTDTAAAVGVSAENANRFYERLKASESVMRKKFEELEKSLAGTPEEKQKQMETLIKAELNQMAVETMGDKGPSVVEKLFKSGR